MSNGMSKEDTVIQLKDSWDTAPQNRKPLIYSLLGHRVKFSTIAEEIGKSVEEVRAAYKGESYVMSMSADFDKSMELVDAIEPGVSPKVMQIAPSKAMYHLPFEDLLQKYRDSIGWKSYPDNLPTPGEGPNDPDYLNGIIISDLHVPFHDEEKFAAMINETRGKVDVCILAGDGPDFHNYSRFIKYGQHFTIQDEQKAFVAVLAALSESYPEIIMFPGNHDERTRKKYAQLLGPEFYQAVLSFHGANAFDFAELMAEQFENIIIPPAPTKGFADYRFLYQITGTDIVVGHPELFSKIACKSVSTLIDWLKKKAEPAGIIKHFNHAVMGHTHQAGKIYADFGIIGIENASLSMTPDYDGNPKLSGCLRPVVHGYTRFKTNRATGITAKNDINLVYL